MRVVSVNLFCFGELPHCQGTAIAFSSHIAKYLAETAHLKPFEELKTVALTNYYL
jgi:hypothetical protein